MKISTDSILFGSWCQTAILEKRALRILDIGAGTGVLSLMLAQKTQNSASITALEIDQAAAQQASENIADSPWSDKINVQHSSLQDYAEWCMQSNSPPFDLIISNPPWFDYAPKARHNHTNQKREFSRTLARQQIELTLEDLFHVSVDLLVDDGEMFLLLPASAEGLMWQLLSNQSLNLVEKANVLATPKHSAHCQLWHLQKVQKVVIRSEQEIVIWDEQNVYSTQFKTLCKDFYLNF